MILRGIVVYFHSSCLDLAYSGHTVGALKRPGSWEDLSAVTYCICLTDCFFFILETEICLMMGFLRDTSPSLPFFELSGLWRAVTRGPGRALYQSLSR